jgi:hypothetical protein
MRIEIGGHIILVLIDDEEPTRADLASFRTVLDVDYVTESVEVPKNNAGLDVKVIPTLEREQ